MARSKAVSRKRVVGSLPREALNHPEATIKRQPSSGRQSRRTRKQRSSSPSPARHQSKDQSRNGSPSPSGMPRQKQQLNYNVPNNSQIFDAALAVCMVKASEIQE